MTTQGERTLFRIHSTTGHTDLCAPHAGELFTAGRIFEGEPGDEEGPLMLAEVQRVQRVAGLATENRGLTCAACEQQSGRVMLHPEYPGAAELLEMERALRDS